MKEIASWALNTATQRGATYCDVRIVDDRIRALMTIVVEGNRGAEVLHALRGHPNVTGLHSTNGRWDLIAELRADSLEGFDRALGNIRLIDGIASTETSLLLSTHKV